MLADAIAINHEEDPPFNLGDRLLDRSQLLEILPILITTEGVHNVVQIAHFSVVEYLESARIMDGPTDIFHLERSKAMNSIIKDCFDFLKSYAHPINQKLLGDNTEAFSPFEEHALQTWQACVESLHAPIDPEISRLVVDFVVNMESIRKRHHYRLRGLRAWSAFIKAPGDPLGRGLYRACEVRTPNIARILLETGADIDFRGGYFGTALQAAAAANMPEIVRMLLDAGADINSQAGYNGTALQIAGASGDLELVQVLLDAGVHVNSVAGNRDTALQIATARGYLEMVKLLLDAGADANSQAGGWGTALKIAALNGCREVVELLLEAGC